MQLKKDVSNAKIRSKEDKIPDITKVATNASPNAKINEVKAEIRSNTNQPQLLLFLLLKMKYLMLVIQTKTDFNTKINEAENKITDHDHINKYITTPIFNKLTAENFASRLKQAYLAKKSNSK